MSQRFDRGLIGRAILQMQPCLEHLSAFEKMEALGTLALMEAMNAGCDKASVEEMFTAMRERMVDNYETFALARDITRS